MPWVVYKTKRKARKYLPSSMPTNKIILTPSRKSLLMSLTMRSSFSELVRPVSQWRVKISSFKLLLLNHVQPAAVGHKTHNTRVWIRSRIFALQKESHADSRWKSKETDRDAHWQSVGPLSSREWPCLSRDSGHSIWKKTYEALLTWLVIHH